MTDPANIARDVHGETAREWGVVRDAFAANFEAGRESGAAFCAYHRGRKVVDLWGGIADKQTGAPWNEDTIVVVFSTTKGFTAMCAHHLADRGALDLDSPVAAYWPEFTAAGKQHITVAQILGHEAGLYDVDATLTLEQVYAWEPVIEALAAQAPLWEPGTRHGYHATTFGWLVGEIVRRASGRSLGRYFAEEIVAPLAADAWIGLPASEEPRVARLQSAAETAAEAAPGADPAEMKRLMDEFLGPGTMLGRALAAPGGAFADVDFNSREFHAAEIGAAGGVTDARSIARLYAGMIGEVDGVRLVGAESLGRAIRPRTTGPDAVIMDLDLQWSLGFMVPTSLMMPGRSDSFGHYGAGGSVGWADPSNELAFGYVMNRMDMGLMGDPRSTTLVDACYAALAG